ncbi:MAG: hypothetical protein M3N29_09225 [Chloroflexota bacterium]|nr:hypothetical protein [Chloroflexota bacterium]
MDSSRPLPAGLSALPRVHAPTGVDLAVAAVVARPTLWLTGALGFLLRGGVFVLLVPVLVLPTPIDIRAFIGDGLGSAGFSPALIGGAIALGVVAVVLTLGALLVLAWLELVSFELLVAARDGSRRAPESLRPLRGRPRRRLLVALFAIQFGAFAVIALAAVPVMVAAAHVTYAEILRPSSGAWLYARILAGVQQPLFALAVAVVAAELLSARATRALLVRQLGRTGTAGARDPGEGAARLLGGVLRTLATVLLGWSVTLVAVVPALWALGLAWQHVRTVLLLPEAGVSAAGVAVAILLAAAWMAAIVLVGFASALRAALWSMAGPR